MYYFKVVTASFKWEEGVGEGKLRTCLNSKSVACTILTILSVPIVLFFHTDHTVHTILILLIFTNISFIEVSVNKHMKRDTVRDK